MKSVTRILSPLLAGVLVCSLAACGASQPGTPASGADAAQTQAAPQGRWVEQLAAGIPDGLVLACPSVTLADGSLVLYARDESGDTPADVRLTSTDNGASWQTETLDWTDTAGALSVWTARPDGTVVFGTTGGTVWMADPAGSLTQLDLAGNGGELYLSDLCFLPDGTLAVAPAGRPGVALQGDLLFYDVDSQTETSWVQISGGSQGLSGAAADASGEMTYTGSNEIACIFPGGEETDPFLYYLYYNGDLCRADLDGTTQTVQSAFVADPYGAKAAPGTDGSLCYADSTGIYRQTLGGSLWEQVVEGSGTALSLASNYIAHMSCAPDGSYLVLLRDESMQDKLYRYAFDATLAAATDTLEVWSLEETPTVRAAIQVFTRENPDCAVDYTVALQDAAGLTREDALRTLNTELLAGEGPDLLILDGADLESFVQSGLLADLSGAVESAGLYDFVAQPYTAADGTVPLLPARFSLPVMHGAAGSLDDVSTLEDVAALAEQYAPRPAEESWAPLEESRRYALGFDSVDSLVQFALQTSQPALLTGQGLDEDALDRLLTFLQTVGEYYDLADCPEANSGSGVVSNFGGVDAVTWYAGMSEYAQAGRAVFGYGTMTTPGWLGATDADRHATGQTILQPGLCQGAYLPACFVAVSAGSDQPDYALAFAAALFGQEVQGSYQQDGMPVTETGMQAFLDRNLPAMEENGYTGGLETLLAGVSTPVVVDETLRQSLVAHTQGMLAGTETRAQAAAGVVEDLSLRFAEQG